MNTIELKNLNFSYGNFKAIDNVSLTVGPGVYGLLGPNGAGKTTLMKILMGFLSPDSGEGTVLGKSIIGDRRDIRRKVGYMPESDCLIPGMDAVTITAYLGELSGMPRQEAVKRAHEVLFYVGLEEARYRKVDTYSSGMKQRIKLATALVHDPELLVLDEPTSGMDPGSRKEMLELIGDIASKKKINILITSHILADIESTCQDVIIINKGKVVSAGAVSKDATAGYVIFEMKFTGEAEKFLDAMKLKFEKTEKGLYRVMLPTEFSKKDLFEKAIAAGVQIRFFKESEATLEETFINAIGGGDAN